MKSHKVITEASVGECQGRGSDHLHILLPVFSLIYGEGQQDHDFLFI